MASQKQTLLTRDQVIAAVLESDDDKEYSSFSEDSSSHNGSFVEDVLDENGDCFDLASAGSLIDSIQFIPDDPCNRDSLMIDNVSIVNYTYF